MPRRGIEPIVNIRGILELIFHKKATKTRKKCNQLTRFPYGVRIACARVCKSVRDSLKPVSWKSHLQRFWSKSRVMSSFLRVIKEIKKNGWKKIKSSAIWKIKTSESELTRCCKWMSHPTQLISANSNISCALINTITQWAFIWVADSRTFSNWSRHQSPAIIEAQHANRWLLAECQLWNWQPAKNPVAIRLLKI